MVRGALGRESGSPLVGHPPPPASRARRAGAGPEGGAPEGRGAEGGATQVTQGACGWAQNASLSLQRRV